MPSSSSLRGSRIGAGPPGVPDAGSQELASRTTVLFRCGQGHKVILTFADEEGAEIPASTACRRCGMPAARGSAPPALPKPCSIARQRPGGRALLTGSEPRRDIGTGSSAKQCPTQRNPEVAERSGQVSFRVGTRP